LWIYFKEFKQHFAFLAVRYPNSEEIFKLVVGYLLEVFLQQKLGLFLFEELMEPHVVLQILKGIDELLKINVH
jgi:hypothetical protein